MCAKLCTSITQLWARTCNYCLWPFDKQVVMATVVVGCMCAMVEGTCIIQIQHKGDLSPEAILT